MNNFIVMFHCISSFLVPPAYVDGAYKATVQVICDQKAYKQDFYESLSKPQNELLSANLSIFAEDGKLKAVSTVEVKRPWIAPQPLFMLIAVDKHKDQVLQKIIELYNKGESL